MENNNNYNGGQNQQPQQPQPMQQPVQPQYQQYQQPYQQPMQPQYQQPYQQPMQPQYQQPMQPEDPDAKKKAKLGKLLCFISLGLMILSVIFLMAFLTAANYADPVRFILFSMFALPYVASWVLLIIARVKSRNRMSMIMMIVFGAVTVAFGAMAFMWLDFCVPTLNACG